MLITNLKIFISNLRKQRLFTAINVLGLGIGLASCLLISLYVLDEFSYDSQHPDAERIYRISSFLIGAEGDRTPIPSASPLAGPLLQENFPEVEAFTRIAEEPVYLSHEDRGDLEQEVRFVENGFFSFFHFDWLQGDPMKALAEPDSIVLTQSLAAKYFGNVDAIGRELQMRDVGPLRVSGVIRDTQRTHLSGSAFVTLGTLERLMGPGVLEAWYGGRFQVYVRLQEGVVFSQLQPAIHAFLEDQMPPAAKALYDVDSIALRDIHLSAPQVLGLDAGSRRTEVLTLMVVCAGLLAIACINFINLATARSTERGKEVAMRKVMGAERSQIFLQHMVESALQVVFALLLGFGLAELALPVLNAFSGKDMRLVLGSLWMLAIMGLGCLVALLAGAYPALHLSRFRPVAVFQSRVRARMGAYTYRDLLVILQFAIAIVLIVATTVIYQQVQYGKNLALGFDKERVFVISNPPGESWELLKERWLREPGVSQVSAAMSPPFKPIATSISARHESRPEGENLAFYMVDFDYFKLFDVAFLAGRSFAAEFGGDRAVQPTEADPHGRASLVLNRAMAAKLGWAPDEAVGQQIELNWSTDYSLSIVGQVIGVAEDMRVDSVRRDIVPLLYIVPASVAGLPYVLLKLQATADIPATLEGIDMIWRDVYPQQPLNRYFLDAEFQTLYATEEAQVSLLAVFSTLAVVISCLGLFGLATFTAQQRGRGVGIRKTLGGSVWSIVILLTNDFSKLVLIANVIAWPFAYVAMQRWLENFAYRIDLTPLIFIGSGLIALCIAWVTVGGTAAKAANAKPVLALRYE